MTSGAADHRCVREIIGEFGKRQRIQTIMGGGRGKLDCKVVGPLKKAESPKG